MLRPDVEEALDAHFDRFVFGVGFCEMCEKQCQGLSVFECLRAALLLIGQLEMIFYHVVGDVVMNCPATRKYGLSIMEGLSIL